MGAVLSKKLKDKRIIISQEIQTQKYTIKIHLNYEQKLLPFFKCTIKKYKNKIFRKIFNHLPYNNIFGGKLTDVTFVFLLYYIMLQHFKKIH